MPVWISPCGLVMSLLLAMILLSCRLEAAPVARYCRGNLAANRDPGGESNRQRLSHLSLRTHLCLSVGSTLTCGAALSQQTCWDHAFATAYAHRFDRRSPDPECSGLTVGRPRVAPLSRGSRALRPEPNASAASHRIAMVTGDLVVFAWVLVEDGAGQRSRRSDGSGSAHAGEPRMPRRSPLPALLPIGEDAIDRRRLADQRLAAVGR